MALPKLFQRIFWHNNTTPALAEDNLNAMSKGLSDVDDRLISLAGTIQEDVVEIQEDMEILNAALETIDDSVASAQGSASTASAKAIIASNKALVAEGFAVGEQNGTEVGQDSDYYENNAKYYANIANPPIRVLKDYAPIISITDAINEKARDVKIKLEPQQDLHGYTKPWVGGVGKNKLPLKVSSLKSMNSSGTWSGSVYTKGGLTFSAETNDGENVNVININGSASERIVFYLNSRFSPPSGQYTLSKTANTSSISMVASAYNNTTWVKTLTQFSGGSGTFTIDYDGYDRIEIYILIQSGTTISNVKFYPQLELGSIATDFEPYTNICPITGWSQIQLARMNKNLLPFDIDTIKSLNPGGTWNGNTYSRYGVSVTVNSDGTYNVVTSSSPSGTFIFFLGEYSAKGLILNGCPSDGSDSKYKLQSFYSGAQYNDYGSGVTIPDDLVRSFRIVIYPGAGAINKTFAPMLRTPTFDDAYEQFQGNYYIVLLNGMYYGARYDATSGEFVVEKVYVNLGTLTWTRSGTGVSGKYRFSVVLSPQAKLSDTTNGVTTLCSHYSALASGGTYSATNDGYVIASDGTLIFYLDAYSGSTAEQFKTAMDGVQLVYTLATPQTLTKTALALELFFGNNTLYANSGDVLLEYDASGIVRIADAKLDIDVFKEIVAASTDFANFKTRVAQL